MALCFCYVVVDLINNRKKAWVTKPQSAETPIPRANLLSSRFSNFLARSRTSVLLRSSEPMKANITARGRSMNATLAHGSAEESNLIFAKLKCFKTTANGRFQQGVRSTCFCTCRRMRCHLVGDKCVACVEQLVPDFTKQIIAMQFVFYCNAQRVSWIAHLQIRQRCPTCTTLFVCQ